MAANVSHLLMLAQGVLQTYSCFKLLPTAFSWPPPFLPP